MEEMTTPGISIDKRSRLREHDGAKVEIRIDHHGSTMYCPEKRPDAIKGSLLLFPETQRRIVTFSSILRRELLHLFPPLLRRYCRGKDVGGQQIIPLTSDRFKAPGQGCQSVCRQSAPLLGRYELRTTNAMSAWRLEVGLRK